MSSLRIGLFTECYRPIRNGIVASIDALAFVARARGHDATVVTPHMPGFVDSDGDVVRLPSLPLPTRTAYRLTVPYYSHGARAFSIVHAHSPFVTGWLALREARRARVPLVFTYHTQLDLYAHYVPFESHATRFGAARLTRSFANAADVVIVPTSAMERRLRELGVTSDVVVVPSGIDVALFAAGRRRDDVRARLGVSPGDAMILTVGRLGREKNVERILEAFARLDVARARFVSIGDGPHRAELERAARRLGIADRVTFAREVPRATLPDAYASADAFAFASRTETQGLVLSEASAAGARVVAIDTPQTREVLAGSGSLARDDADDLARVLRTVLAERGQGDRLRRPIPERFSRAAAGDRILRVYGSLVPDAAPPLREIVHAR